LEQTVDLLLEFVALFQVFLLPLQLFQTITPRVSRCAAQPELQLFGTGLEAPQLQQLATVTAARQRNERRRR
jgi:hypothetical protein